MRELFTILMTLTGFAAVAAFVCAGLFNQVAYMSYAVLFIFLAWVFYKMEESY